MPKIPAGATYKPSQALPQGATFDDAPAASQPSQAPQPGAMSKAWNATDPNMHTISAQPSVGSIPWIKSQFYTYADKATNLLPAIGGAGGGLIGGAAGTAGAPGPGTVGGGIAGAAIGGAGGEAARQLARRSLGFEVPKTAMDAAEGIGGEGLRQGAYEAGGQLFGRMGKAIAPKLAEASVAPGKRMLKSLPEGVDIGKTLLTETKSVRPKAIVDELSAKIGNTSKDLDTMAGNAHLPGAYVNLDPARNIASGELSAAVAKNSPSYIRDVEKVNSQLTNQFGPGGKRLAALPPMVDPSRARSLKQGLDLEIGNWNPESQSAIAPLQERVRGAINEGFHNAVPGSAELDKRMTSLIPAKEAAWNTSFNPGLTRGVLERFARPTGALVGAGLGASEGYKQGGGAGAVAGGLFGLAAPNMITSPTGLMIGARALDSQLPSRLLRYSIPALESQRDRPEDEQQRKSGYGSLAAAMAARKK